MISLRDMRVEDREKIRLWRNLPQVSEYMCTNQHITAPEHKRWFLNILNDPSCHYWIIVYNETDVGLVSIHNIDLRHRRCYWSFYIANSCIRGRGIGSFVEYLVLCHVFEKLELNKLCGEVLAFNETVINMHRKVGFLEEGYLCEHIVRDGQVFDVVVIAMLRAEWLLNKPKLEKRLVEKGLL